MDTQIKPASLEDAFDLKPINGCDIPGKLKSDTFLSTHGYMQTFEDFQHFYNLKLE